MDKHIFFLFFFSSLLLSAQEQQKVVLGVIWDENTVIANAHIINMTTKEGTFSDENGFFSITGSLGDVLQVSSVPHLTDVILITKEMFLQNQVKIQLHTKTNMLEEVIVKNHPFSGDLETDMNKVVPNYKERATDELVGDLNAMLPLIKYMKVEIDAMDREKPPIVEFPELLQGFTFVSATVAVLSGRKWRLRKEKWERKKNFPDVLLEDLGSHFFFQELKIPEHNYYAFITFCEPLNIEELFYQRKKNLLVDILDKQSVRYREVVEK